MCNTHYAHPSGTGMDRSNIGDESLNKNKFELMLNIVSQISSIMSAAETYSACIKIVVKHFLYISLFAFVKGNIFNFKKSIKKID